MSLEFAIFFSNFANSVGLVFVLVQSNVTFSGCDIFHVFCMFCPCSVPFSGAASSLNGFWIHPVNGPARAACCVSCSLSEYIENAGNTSSEHNHHSTGCRVTQHGLPRRLSVCPHPQSSLIEPVFLPVQHEWSVTHHLVEGKGSSTFAKNSQVVKCTVKLLQTLTLFADGERSLTSPLLDSAVRSRSRTSRIVHEP